MTASKSCRPSHYVMSDFSFCLAVYCDDDIVLQVTFLRLPQIAGV